MMLTNVCLYPTTSFWPLTLLLCQTYTSSPQYRSCGRWLSSRWWAVCPFTSSSTYADASPRPATPSWQLKDWEEPPATFTAGKQIGAPVFIQQSLRLDQRITHGFIPFNLFGNVPLWHVTDGHFCQGQVVYWEGEFELKSSVYLLHVFAAKTSWWFLCVEKHLHWNVDWVSLTDLFIVSCRLRIVNINMSWIKM